MPDRKHDRALKGQAALSRSITEQANGDPELADRLRREHFSEMGKRSGSRRRALAAAKRAALVAELEARTGSHITTMDELARMVAGERSTR